MSNDKPAVTPAPKAPARLAERLAACIKLVHGIGKDGKNENQGYAFVREVDVMARVRGVLADNGVIVVPRVARVEFRSVPTKSGQASLTDVHMVFAVMATDTDEVFECPWYGCGADTTDKGGNKAITSAEKYFLLKLLKIPTEKDPDADAEKDVTVPAKVEAPKPVPVPVKASVLSREEIEAMHSLAKAKGLNTVTAFREYLKGLTGNEQAKDLSRGEYASVMDALKAMREKVPA
jgi:hypothetical protein